MSDKLNALRAEIPLNGDVQAFFDELPEADKTRLAGLVLDAAAQQEAQIDEAGEAALKLVPGILRGRVKSMLFGGKS
ncbi:MAG: hypothetical protein CMN28_07435 [Salinisphaeraceae bacterium]|nr:hypothetical protein [Salinisphaeraceae bacterium]